MIEASSYSHTMRSAALASFLGLLAALTFLWPNPAAAQDQSAGVALSPEAQQILTALNVERAAAGLTPLDVDPLLSQAAQVQADDILSNRNYSHRGTDGTLARDRVARTGYAANPWVSENWVSSSSPERAMTWWMNDYIHRVNILTPRWREVGIGAAIRPDTGEMVFVTVFSPGRDAVAGPVANASAVAEPLAVAPSGVKYTVQPGDTLLDIALRYGMDWTDIAAANAITDSTLLQIGQVLQIPGNGSESVEVSVTGSPVASESGIGGPAGAPNALEHTIRSGETLFSIALANGMTWQELARFNGLGEDAILQIGQTIRIPVATAPSEPQDDATQEAVTNNEPAPDAAEVYTVQAGDTIFGIALAHSTDWLDLLAINNLSEDSMLQPGQTIRLR